MVKTKQKKRVAADTLTSRKAATKERRHNPFEVHTNKEKFTIMGRQLKHDRGQPGVSRAKALARRRDTLGQEFLTHNKSNQFRDRRIGEQTMTREEAASARFIAERLQQQERHQRRESLFNLREDDAVEEGGEDLLTHKGQTLSEIEQFADGASDDDDEDDVLGKLGDEFTGAAHFGGGAAAPDAAEQRQSAIKQLIAEQKRRKEEISREKEEVGDLTAKLDDDWRKLIPLMAKLSKEDERCKPKPDAYDRALREMVFEPRGDVSDKLRSEAEVAKAEKERLERLERERLERMAGVTEEEKKLKHRSADDLDDGYWGPAAVVAEKPTLAYELEEKDGKKKKTKKGKKSAEEEEESDDEDLLAAAAQKGDAEEEEEDDDDEEEAEGEEEGSAEEDEESGSEEDEESGSEADSLDDLRAVDASSESEAEETAATDAKKPKLSAESSATSVPAVTTEADRQAMMAAAAAELPYTFELPESYGQLEQLLAGRNAEFQSVILERMIKCNHPRLLPETKPQMAQLFAFLLQHLNDVFEAAGAETVAEAFRLVQLITPHLYDLAVLNGAETTRCFQEVLREKQSDFRATLIKRWPALDTLCFLQLSASLFSCSDYRHSICTPAYVFASQLLARCRVSQRTDIAAGLLLCTTLLEYGRLSRRFVPAAINFLAGCLFLAVPKRAVEVLAIVPPFQSTGPYSSLLAIGEAEAEAAKAVQVPAQSLRVSDLQLPGFDVDAKVRLANAALRLSADMLRLLVDNVGAQYFAGQLGQHLDRLDESRYPAAVLRSLAELKTTVAAIQAKPLSLLVAAAKKPKALRLLEPHFEKVYDDKRTRGPGNKDKAVRDGMLRKIKEETRGAIREIRRDTAFLANVQLKRQMAADAERKEKVRRIFAEASVQQGELNAMDRKRKHL